MAPLDAREKRRIGKIGAVAVGVAPLVGLAVGLATDRLGPEPEEALLHETGVWALRFLVATLAVTPLYRWTGWSQLVAQRGTLGLFSFGYAFLHLVVYVSLEIGLDPIRLGEEVGERPYITAGFATFCMLAVLATTSTRGWKERLGPRWKSVHRLVYAAAIGATVHYVWLAGADLSGPIVYAALFALLLGVRAYRTWRRGRSRDAMPSRST